MRIADIRATPVTVPLEAPLRHANGCHWGRFVRTIVEVETDDGLVGLGEMGGGGETATAAFEGLKPYLVGRDPARLEEMRFLVANPTASLYNNRTQVLAALEFACLDLLGQKWGVPVSEILGGRLRDRVPFASYLFFRYPRPEYQGGEVRAPEQLVAQARALKKEHGFTSHKLKGGVFPPEYELECYRALAKALPGDRFRFDPNGVWSAEQAIWFGQQIEGLRNDYLEDPVYGLHGLRRVREKVRMPLATNTVVVNFEQLAANVLSTAVDVILLDTTFWGGIRPCLKAAGICETFQLGVAVHSSGELGIQLATMLHMGAVLPNLTFAADAHYHHLTDDVIEGGRLGYQEGAIAVPTGPGLGVRLDREKVAEYHELFRRLGPYPYDQDPLRPGWTPLVPLRQLNTNRNVQILAKLESFNPGGSIKDRPAFYMIEEAERTGELTKDKIILEATSGNTGIGLSLVAAVKGYRILLVMSEAASEERKKILKAMGADLQFTPAHMGTDGSIEFAYNLAREEPLKFWLADQFNNDANWLSHYHGTAQEIWEQTGGDLDKALGLAQKALAQRPEEPSVLDTVGWVYYKKTDTAKAVEYLEKARAKSADDPSVNYHLGMAYAKAGKKEQAKEYLKKALAAGREFQGKADAEKALGGL